MSQFQCQAAESNVAVVVVAAVVIVAAVVAAVAVVAVFDIEVATLLQALQS